MHNRFELAFFVRLSAQTVSLEEYLAGRRQGLIDWYPDLENATLYLTVHGTEYIAGLWSLGALRQLLPQLLPARERLAQGQTTLIRAGVDDSETGTYFLLEPKEGTVNISMFYLSLAPYSHYYPVPEHSPQAQDLYTYVLAHREGLLAHSATERGTFQNIAYPLADLLLALAQQYELAQEFAQEFGPL